MFVERNLGNHRALERGYIAGWEPIQGVHDHVGPTHLAAAKLGEMGSEGIVGLDRMIFDRILELHRTAITCFAKVDPVNVDPVVPVSRTS